MAAVFTFPLRHGEERIGALDLYRATFDNFQNSALHDPLTGLPNRLLLQQRLSDAAKRAERSHAYAAVLFADLDHFKQINDAHGHHVGDELLIAVARRLAELVRPGDTLARVSGDEFVFLCEDLERASDVEILAVRINSALAVPFPLATVTVTLTASVGMAFARTRRRYKQPTDHLRRRRRVSSQARRRCRAPHH